MRAKQFCVLTTTESRAKSSVFVFVFVMHYFVSIHFCNHLEEEMKASWLLCYYCFTDVLLLYTFCDSSSRSHGLVYSMLL